MYNDVWKQLKEEKKARLVSLWAWVTRKIPQFIPSMLLLSALCTHMLQPAFKNKWVFMQIKFLTCEKKYSWSIPHCHLPAFCWLDAEPVFIVKWGKGENLISLHSRQTCLHLPNLFWPFVCIFSTAQDTTSVKFISVMCFNNTFLINILLRN